MPKQTAKSQIEIDLNRPISLRRTNRDELRAYFVRTWQNYEDLFSSIKDERSFELAPDPLRNPLIFYYGHTAAFYINKLMMGGLIDKGITPRLESLFATGVDPELPEHLSKETRYPALEEVKKYRTAIYEVVLRLIETIDIPAQTTSAVPLWNLHMAIEHDRIHFETSSVLIRQLDENLVRKPAGWEYAPTFGFSEEFALVKVEGGKVMLGNQEPSDLFGWDNEFGHLLVDVKSFATTKNMITNGEFIHFVKKGGYHNEEFWTSEGLEWKKRVDHQIPKFWIKEKEKYRYRAMFDIIDMPLDWPAEVNVHEAKAYCKFKGSQYRLMSEAEFKLLTKMVHENLEPATAEKFNLKMKFGSASPVGFLEPDEGAHFNDLYGNVWEWLSNEFYPLPGFKAHPHYLDFSLPYFDDKHRMLIGGSWATSGAGASQYYRLWFRDHFFQHAGFRLTKDIED